MIQLIMKPVRIVKNNFSSIPIVETSFSMLLGLLIWKYGIASSGHSCSWG